MRETRLSGSVEGVMGNHDSYSDSEKSGGRGRPPHTNCPHKLLLIGRSCLRIALRAHLLKMFLHHLLVFGNDVGNLRFLTRVE